MLLMQLVFHSSVRSLSRLFVGASNQYSKGLRFKSQLDNGTLTLSAHNISILLLANFSVLCVYLQNVAISVQQIGFATLTVESDGSICVKKNVTDTSQVVTINLGKVANQNRRCITADSAIINSGSNVFLKGTWLHYHYIRKVHNICPIVHF